ncbi:cardiolipin synthase [Desulfosporosinus metallidurans]|uniref:Cardiolipin synthase n=1 Tax=Desulfosporosinus metallidurans TaxID=1888891 RepID=A0A1Q8QIF1_9FIRM|nr:cardiolipin synthase [Desulfosporosinus metallidurans]OLN27058.1 Cardiolipin synthetase [Desulfosporosinus metallidurans]
MICFILIALVPLLGLLAAQLVVILESRNPEKTASWLAIFATWPIFGWILYILFGCSPRKAKLFRLKHLPGSRLPQLSIRQKEELSSEDIFFQEGSTASKRLARLLLQSGFAPLSRNNRVTVLTNGEEKFNALLRDLESAQDHIHMEYYIFRADQIGKEIQALLIRKSRSGAKVRMVFDGLGSRHLPKVFLQDLTEAGIEIGWFFPLHFPQLIGTLNYRNHRKLVVIDGKTGYLGGINVGDEYLSRDPKYGFWRDTHLRLEGESVQTMQETFLNDWYFITQEEITEERYYPRLEPGRETLTQVIAGGPDSKPESMKELFFTILATAQKEILLTTPYFIPDESMIMALKSAALSGITVKVLVQGKPDHKISYLASSSYYEDLLSAGVEIYQYQKGILHSKVLTVDEQICIVGSANFDIRSFQLDFELSAMLYSSELAVKLNRNFKQDLTDSLQIDREEHANRSLWQKMKEANARLLSPLL